MSPPKQNFVPSWQTFEPLRNVKEVKNIKYKPPMEREKENLASQRGTVANMNSDDSLRRVSVVIHRHIMLFERQRKESEMILKYASLNAELEAEQLQSPISTTSARQLSPSPSLSMEECINSPDVVVSPIMGRRSSSLSNKPRYRGQLGMDVRLLANTSEMLDEELFLKAEWRYTFLRLPRLPLWTPYQMVRVEKESTMPTVEMIYSFIRHLFVEAQLSSECSVVCLIYVERLMERANVELRPANWRPILLCGLLLASKVWQDLSSWNIEFARVYPQFSLRSINNLERVFLRLLQWDLYISGAVYAKYYFALRSLNESRNFRRRYNYIMQVNNWEARQVEQRSAAAGNSNYSRSM